MQNTPSDNAAQRAAIEAMRSAPSIHDILASFKPSETATNVITAHAEAMGSQETSAQRVGRLVHSQVTTGALLASKAREADSDLSSLLSSLPASEPSLMSVARQWAADTESSPDEGGDATSTNQSTNQ